MPQHVPHRGPQTAVAMQREGDSALLRVPGQQREAALPRWGLLGEGEPPGPRSLSMTPPLSPAVVSPHASAGALGPLYFSFSVALVESWLVSGDLRGEGVVR